MCKNTEIAKADLSRVNQPVRCANCGAEIYIACGPDTEPAMTKSRKMSKIRRAMHYAPKPCLRCTRMFDPKGPASLYCQREDCTEVSDVVNAAPTPAQTRT